MLLMYTLTTPVGAIYMQSKDNASVKTSGRFIAQFAKMSIDSKLVELTADVFRTYQV